MSNTHRPIARVRQGSSVIIKTEGGNISGNDWSSMQVVEDKVITRAEMLGLVGLTEAEIVSKKVHSVFFTCSIKTVLQPTTNSPSAKFGVRFLDSTGDLVEREKVEVRTKVADGDKSDTSFWFDIADPAQPLTMQALAATADKYSGTLELEAKSYSMDTFHESGSAGLTKEEVEAMIKKASCCDDETGTTEKLHCAPAFVNIDVPGCGEQEGKLIKYIPEDGSLVVTPTDDNNTFWGGMRFAKSATKSGLYWAGAATTIVIAGVIIWLGYKWVTAE